MSVNREQLAKVRMPFRVLAGFILLLSLFAVLATVFFAVTEPYDHIIWALSAAVLTMAYVSAHVAITGYAPKFLLFAHGAKNGL
ncbi:hypothetical protein [Rheinheimera sp.]|uniref:hypothetical protein n=2 Tax=Rheinheimera sp. TaxID=1869214 RepID=UPI004047FC97